MAHDFYKTVKVPLHKIVINPDHVQILDSTAITVNKNSPTWIRIPTNGAENEIGS